MAGQRFFGKSRFGVWRASGTTKGLPGSAIGEKPPAGSAMLAAGDHR